MVDLLVQDNRESFSVNHRATNVHRVETLASMWKDEFSTVPIYAIATRATPESQCTEEQKNELLYDQGNHCYHSFFTHDPETCKVVDNFGTGIGKTNESKYLSGITKLIDNDSYNLLQEDDRLKFLRQVLSDTSTESISYADLKEQKSTYVSIAN